MIGGRVIPGRAGRPRDFTAYEGFAMAALGLLHERGVERGMAADALGCLSVATWPLPWVARPTRALEFRVGLGETALYAAYSSAAAPLVMSIGDAGPSG